MISSLFAIDTLQVSFYFLLALGFIVGLLSGLLGVGGGILLTPSLHVLGLSMPVAVATTLAQMVASSITGTWRHVKQGNTIFGLSIVFGLPAVFGVILGRQLMVHWTKLGVADSWTSGIYTFLLIYVSFQMFRRTLSVQRLQASGSKSDISDQRGWLASFWQLGPKVSLGRLGTYPVLIPFLIGASIGCLSSLTGLGGGFFYVPIMIGLAGLSMNEAVGTSLSCVVMGSIVATLAYLQTGLVDVKVAVFLAIGSSFGSIVGASATRFATGLLLRYLFAFLVGMAAISMILRRESFVDTAYVVLFGSSMLVVVVAVLVSLKEWLVSRR